MSITDFGQGSSFTTLTVAGDLVAGFAPNNLAYLVLSFNGTLDDSLAVGFEYDPTGADKTFYFLNPVGGAQFLTADAVVLPRFTTVQRDAMPDQIFGSVLHNSTPMRLQHQLDPTAPVRWATVEETFQVALPYSAAMTPDVQEESHCIVTANNGVAFTINAPLNPETNVTLEFTIRNTSGGVLGAATWNAVFKMSAWVQPATGFSRSIRFRYNGANWIELSRTPADVPN